MILTAARERFAADGYERATIRAIAADAGIDDSEKHRAFWKAGGKAGPISRQQIGRRPRVMGGGIGEQVDDRNPRRFLVKHGLHLPLIGTSDAEIGVKNDH